MSSKIRRLPPVCLFYALGRIMTRRLCLSGNYLGSTLESESGNTFTVFRNIHARTGNPDRNELVFVVRFKFARLSFRANKLASIIPMLLIAGFPGFRQKIYAVNQQNEYWQGMYQWRSETQLQEYLHSFVYRMMNRRALERSITTRIYPCKNLEELIKSCKR